MSASDVDVSQVEHFVCGHCQVPHVQVTVQLVRCRCGGTGFIPVSSSWGGWDRPCMLCPGDGWVATYNGGEVDRQELACQARGVAVFRSWRQTLHPGLTRPEFLERTGQAHTRYEVVCVSSLDDAEARI